MARKISTDAARAFLDGERFAEANTVVTVDWPQGEATMILRDSRIATANVDHGQGIAVTLAGWDTNLTRERLNTLLTAWAKNRGILRPYLHRHKGQPMLSYAKDKYTRAVSLHVQPTAWYHFDGNGMLVGITNPAGDSLAVPA
jgi:hypothetical protein